MSQTLERPKVLKVQVLKVLPYVNPDSENMGLSKYGFVLHEGATHKESLTCLEKNGVKRYLTGLNEHAPEVTALKGDDKINAIREIRTKVVFLEKALGSNEIDIDDEKFWEKVETVHPTNDKFWKEVDLECGNEPVFLNPEEPFDLIKICGIEAGGFSTVAKSYEDAQLAPTPPKFYLDRATSTASTKTEIKKIKNEALATLDNIYRKDSKKLLHVIKAINPNAYSYKYDTPVDVLYDYLDEYISGKGLEKSAKLAATNFNIIAKLPAEDLRIKAVIADAAFYKIIVEKSGLLYYRNDDTVVGKNISEVLSHFKNPMYSKQWEALFVEIEAYWKD